MFSPLNSTLPLRGSMMPEMVFRIVVLPAPLAAQHGDDLARAPQADAADGLDRAVGALDVG
jgi:hypothetical protein